MKLGLCKFPVKTWSSHWRRGELVLCLLPTSSPAGYPGHSAAPQSPGCKSRPLVLSQHPGRAPKGWRRTSPSLLGPLHQDLDLMLPYWKEGNSPLLTQTRWVPGNRARCLSWGRLVGKSLCTSQVPWASVERFFFQTARELISIPERTTARISSTQLQRLRSAWLRPAQTINNASLLSPTAPGTRAGEAPALCDWAQESATWGSHLGHRASVPPVPSGPRKFLESANSYLTQKVIAQLLGYGRGCLRSPGDFRRPFIHKLPLCFYTVQCTPSAKESESSTLQSPGSSLHGSHTRLHTSGKERGERSKIEKNPERLALSTLGALDHFSLPVVLRGDRRHLIRGWAAASAQCSASVSRLSGAPALQSRNGNECLHVKSTKAISWRQIYLD